MLRKIIASLVIVAVGSGVAFGAGKKKGHTVLGTVTKVDAASGTLTVAVKHKKQTTEKDFTVPDEAKIVVGDGKEKQEATGKAGLKADQIKPGVAVAIVSDPQGKVVEVRFGAAAKGKKKAHGITGVVKSINATSGILTLTVKHKKATTDRDFTISTATRFLIFDGTQKMEIAGKDGLKNEQLKEGVTVTVHADQDGKATLVRVGQHKKGKKAQD
jgi:hypothetical protein